MINTSKKWKLHDEVAHKMVVSPLTRSLLSTDATRTTTSDNNQKKLCLSIQC